MESGRLRDGRFRGMCVCVGALIATLALTVAPAHAKAASPVLEFVAPGTAFPIGFTAEGGPVTAELAGFDSVVHCSDSVGDGVITGPRSTVSNYFFTGCVAQGGAHNDQECKSEGAANAKEITAEAIEADLVYIDQAKHEVGMLLNPGDGVYMTFECGGELVEASGRFLSPVGPINKEATSFTATLSQSGAAQTPNEYENALGEKRPAIPMGKRESDPTPHTTGVELSFTIHTNASLQIKAVTAAEIEAKQREDEAAAAAAAKKRQDEEAAAAAAAKRRQDEEAAAAAAEKKRQEEEVKSERLRRALLSGTLEQCRKAQSKHRRVRCEKRAKKKYGSAKSR
jgi:pyruvate/2-oxoglutarate dehydrogenase complex dihydrolipoamide acyltransferase (E2) component